MYPKLGRPYFCTHQQQVRTEPFPFRAEPNFLCQASKPLVSRWCPFQTGSIKKKKKHLTSPHSPLRFVTKREESPKKPENHPTGRPFSLGRPWRWRCPRKWGTSWGSECRARRTDARRGRGQCREKDLLLGGGRPVSLFEGLSFSLFFFFGGGGWCPLPRSPETSYT